jgi:enamine deaminase RidA (YjgF/YER057c/UK114 family)
LYSLSFRLFSFVSTTLSPFESLKASRRYDQLQPCLTFNTTTTKALASAITRSIATHNAFALVTASSALVKVRRSKSKLLLIKPSNTDHSCIHPGGWDPKTGEYFKETNAQIDQAFANVDLALKDAGGKGWEQVFRVNSYHIPLNDEALAAMVRNFAKWMPGHCPIWTTIGVTRLGEDDMRVEIEVVAHDPK